MKTLSRFGITVGFDEEKGEIASIKALNAEILYQGDQNWKKTFPIMFPNLSFSRGFKYNQNTYNLPKHGFWANLAWSVTTTWNKIISKAVINHVNYPFQFEIIHTITIWPNTIVQKVKIINVGYGDAFFHFGFHPAFKIDKSSFIFFSEDREGYWTHGETNKLTTKKVILNENTLVDSLQFGENNSSIFVEDFQSGKVMLENEKLSIWLNIKSPHLILWRNPSDNFLCIEPWYGVQDDLYEFPHDVSKKKNIICLHSRKKFITKLTIKIYEVDERHKKLSNKI